MVLASGVLEHDMGVPVEDSTYTQYYHFPQDTHADTLGLESVDWDPGRFTDTEIIDNSFDNSLELNDAGLIAETGKYTSPVVDLGGPSILNGTYWNEEVGSGVHGSFLTIEARWSTTPPILDSGLLSWQSEEYPNFADPVWGEAGSLVWTEMSNGILTTDALTRYVQWRVTFDVSQIITDETKLGNLTTEDGFNLILE